MCQVFVKHSIATRSIMMNSEGFWFLWTIPIQLINLCVFLREIYIVVLLGGISLPYILSKLKVSPQDDIKIQVYNSTRYCNISHCSSYEIEEHCIITSLYLYEEDHVYYTVYIFFPLPSLLFPCIFYFLHILPYHIHDVHLYCTYIHTFTIHVTLPSLSKRSYTWVVRLIILVFFFWSSSIR